MCRTKLLLWPDQRNFVSSEGNTHIHNSHTYTQHTTAHTQHYITQHNATHTQAQLKKSLFHNHT